MGGLTRTAQRLLCATVSDIAELARLHKAGRSNTEIASAMGVSPSTVSRRLRAAGLAPNTARAVPSMRSIEGAERAIRSAGEDPTPYRVATYLRCDPGTIARILADARGALPATVDRTTADGWYARWCAGESVRAIVESDHRTKRTVAAALRALGADLSPGRKHRAG